MYDQIQELIFWVVASSKSRASFLKNNRVLHWETQTLKQIFHFNGNPMLSTASAPWNE